MKARPSNAYRSLCVKLPGPVKARLSGEAARRGMSVNDLAGSLLGEHYGVDFTVSGRRCTRVASRTKLHVVLRLPSELVEAIRGDAFAERTNLTHQVVLALAGALGVTVKIVSRRTIPLGGGRRLIA